jgi:acetylornithine deacetylase/succinyl-diaminopimelate desuccinylase-like protein
MTANKIEQLVDSWSPDILEFTGELISTPRETPTGDEREITKLLSDKLDKLGLTGAWVTSDAPGHLSLPRSKRVGRVDSIVQACKIYALAAYDVSHKGGSGF